MAAPAPAEPRCDTGGGLFEQSQAASAARGAGDGAAAAPKAPFTLNGYVRGDMFVGKVPDQRAAEMKANYGELSLQLRTAKSAVRRRLRRRAHPLRPAGRAQGTFVDLREAYVNAYLGPFDLRLGKQIIVWGRADALNPTNNLTPVDFRIRSPLEDDIRLGNVGARAFLRLAPVRLEGVWMPVYLATELPTVGLPRSCRSARPMFPSLDLRNGLVAGRVHLELAAFEMSVSYLHGFAPLPGLTLTGADVRPVRPGRDRRADRVRPAGRRLRLLDRARRGGDPPRRGRLPPPVRLGSSKPYAARPDLQYALGADHNFGSLSVIAQYLGRYVFDWQKEPGGDRATPASWTDPQRTRRARWASRPRHRRGQRRARPDQPDPVLADRAGAAHRDAALRMAARARDAVALVAVPAQLHHAGMAGDAAHRLAR